MQTQELGAIHIDKVTEIERLAVPPDFLFGNTSPELLHRYGDQLGPRFIEPGTFRFFLSFHSYLIRTPHHTILVDTCNGNHKQRSSMPAWHMLETPYLQRLARLGVTPEQVDYVMCTHLHADHVGWNTRLVDGQWVPTFPNARYLMARSEFECYEAAHQRDPNAAVNRGSFVDSVLPVVARGQVDLVESTHAIERHLADGIWLEPAPGHTPGNVNVHLQGGGRSAVMCGDVIHHPIQFPEPQLANPADVDKPQALQTRLALMRRYADSDTLLLAGHFVDPTVGRIESRGDRFHFRFVSDGETQA